MKMKTRTIALLALLIAAPVTGQSVYNNGAPNGQAGWNIFDDFRAADDFLASGTFNLIRFWALLPTGYTSPSNIFWAILEDGSAGTPGPTSLVSGSVVAQQTLRTSFAFGFDSWQFDLAVGPQSLGPGIFWLAL